MEGHWSLGKNSELKKVEVTPKIRVISTARCMYRYITR